MKTIAQQLNIKTFPFEINVDGNIAYAENSEGYWYKREYQDGKQVYYEDSDGYWHKREFQDGKCVYYETSNGYIRDDRPKSKAQAKVAEARKLLEEAERELKEQSCKQSHNN